MSARTTPLVSIVIATHNRLPLLREAVDCVRRQTYASIELIVVDDGSSDGTADWLVRQNGLDIVRFDSPVERTRARNAGIAKVSGDFVMVFDDDDHLVPRAIEILSDALRVDRDVVAAIGGYEIFDGQGQSTRGPHPRRRISKNIWSDLMLGWFAHHSRSLLRAGIVRELGGYGIEPPHEDREFWLRISRQGPVVVLPDVIMGYRVHGGMSFKHPFHTQEAIYRAHLETLRAEERERGIIYLTAQRFAYEGRRAYAEQRPFGAVKHLSRAMAASPALLRSPLVGPEFAKLTGKALIGSVVRPAGIRAIRRMLSAKREASGRNPWG